MPIASHLWLSLIERSKSQCEWIYISGERCQNTYQLKAHHKTYERDGNELLGDLTILCPAHHLIADMERKAEIGQRANVIAHRILEILNKKREWLSPEVWAKFQSRYTRELYRTGNDLSAGDDAILWLSSKINPTENEHEIEGTPENIKKLRAVVFRIRVRDKYITDALSARLASIADNIESTINDNVSQIQFRLF